MQVKFVSQSSLDWHTSEQKELTPSDKQNPELQSSPDEQGSQISTGVAEAPKPGRQKEL
jgi:hypothetical protein